MQQQKIGPYIKPTQSQRKTEQKRQATTKIKTVRLSPYILNEWLKIKYFGKPDNLTQCRLFRFDERQYMNTIIKKHTKKRKTQKRYATNRNKGRFSLWPYIHNEELKIKYLFLPISRANANALVGLFRTTQKK